MVALLLWEKMRDRPWPSLGELADQGWRWCPTLGTLGGILTGYYVSPPTLPYTAMLEDNGAADKLYFKKSAGKKR